MGQLPTGIVTFLFTAVESCTTIAERLDTGRDHAEAAALARHALDHLPLKHEVGDVRALAADALPTRDVEGLWLIGRELALDEAVSLSQRWGSAHDITPAPVDADSVVSPS